VVETPFDAFSAVADYSLEILIAALADTQAALIVAGLPARDATRDPRPYATADRLALPLLALPAGADMADLLRELYDVIHARQVAAARFVRDALTAVSAARKAADPLQGLAGALAAHTRLAFVLEDDHRQVITEIVPDTANVTPAQVTAALASYAARQAVRAATPNGAGEDISLQRHLPDQLARAIVPLRSGAVTLAYVSLLGRETDLTPALVDVLWRIAPAFAFELGKLRKVAQTRMSAPPETPRNLEAPALPASAAEITAPTAAFDLSQLLAPLQKTGALDAYCRATLAPLISADTHHGDALIATLDAWFATHGNLTEAARRLALHRNTLMYRLNRIEELLGKSLGDPDVRLALQLALKLWHSAKDAGGSNRA
jgi:hypothetical protein